MKTTILFRADGNNQIGLGHIARTLALADMLKLDFDCRFAIQQPDLALIPQIRGYCKDIIRLPQTNLWYEEAHMLCHEFLTGEEIVVLDGYHFDTNYQKILKTKGSKVVYIDDINDFHMAADLVINHAGGIRQHQYSAERYTRFCLGLDYALLRRPFLEAARDRLLPNAQRIAFVCLGGADPKNQTIRVLRKLERAGQIQQVYVVIGSAYKNRETLEKFVSTSRLDIMILENICAERMVDVMRLCPVAITSPSTIALEYLAVGGDLYLCPTAKNQRGLYAYLTQTRLAFDFKDFPIQNKTILSQARAQQKWELDGKSDARFRKVFRQLEMDLHCRIRQATMEDMETYWEWANDPVTRNQSFSSQPIPFESHKAWFTQKLFSPDTYLYVLEYKGTPVGQIRFDLEKEAVLSYSVAPEARGRGFGSFLLRKGIQRFKKDLVRPTSIVGYVKASNKASNRAFQQLGFRKAQVPGQEDTFVYSIKNNPSNA
ncbi:MAG: UDP-2,4-diacetamido-2,4,6-trideoxy-beta-L-altropyranose hydrolase [Bacteroidetes bacterium]|nr:MAG: UDP-2,4-diacetamido-2,4,6-trideoxy-beta-L-altropyranose hydrolase [Bacteroidota bacterium]